VERDASLWKYRPKFLPSQLERGSAKLRAERSVPVGDTSEEVSPLLDYMISVLNFEAYLMATS